MPRVSNTTGGLFGVVMQWNVSAVNGLEMQD